MIRRAIAQFLCGSIPWLGLTAHGAANDCPELYLAFSVEEMRERMPPLTDVSVFALLTDPKPYLSQRISVSGMMVNSHGRSFLVPVASRKYLFTNDAVKIANGQLPECMVEALDGVPVKVWGVLNENGEGLVVKPVYYLGPIRALTYPGPQSDVDDR